MGQNLLESTYLELLKILLTQIKPNGRSVNLKKILYQLQKCSIKETASDRKTPAKRISAAKAFLPSLLIMEEKRNMH